MCVNQKNVLIASKSSYITQKMKRLISLTGFQILTTVFFDEDLVDELEKRAGIIDILLIDADFSLDNTLKIIKKIKKSYPQIKIAIINNLVHKNFVYEAIHSGVDYIICEPFNSIEYHPVLEKIRQKEWVFH